MSTPEETEDQNAAPVVDVRMLLVFFAATLVMVGAVSLLGLMVRWWMLVPVMLVDFAVTFGVIAVITRQLAYEGDAPS